MSFKFLVVVAVYLSAVYFCLQLEVLHLSRVFFTSITAVNFQWRYGKVIEKNDIKIRCINLVFFLFLNAAFVAVVIVKFDE